MDRRQFLFTTLLSTLSVPIIGKELKFKKAPAIFIGHGSPMNAIEDNQFSKAQMEFGKKLSIPKAILVVSAHWETNGIQIQHSPVPEIIHDFSGFPKSLQEFKYNAKGPKIFPEETKNLLNKHQAILTNNWGLDHGAWSVLTRLFPKAQVPVFQLSINQNATLKEHFEIASELSALREKGLMILGSGNIVHNLRLSEDTPNFKVYDWALEFDQWIQKKIYNRDLKGIFTFDGLDKRIVSLAHPTLEHFIPLLYTLGASSKTDQLAIPIDGFQESAISMKSLFYS